MKAETKIRKIWEIVSWLDEARWNSSRKGGSDVFEDLSSSDKILVHWICMITNRQRDYREVWGVGEPRISKIIEEFKRDGKDVFKILESFTQKSEDGNSIDKFTDGDGTYTPRYSNDFYSIVRTLWLLDKGWNRNIIEYLKKGGQNHLKFWE